MPFSFLDPGLLVDRELELIAPSAQRIDEILRAVEHPLSQQDPVNQNTRRSTFEEFLKRFPHGRQDGNLLRGESPAYHFWMRLASSDQCRLRHIPFSIVGCITLRIGDTPDNRFYMGHLGYGVYPAARGHHYAERASRLLLPLARAHQMKRLWITCNPDNFASRRTCERLGGHLVDVVAVPHDHPLYHNGDREKCRYCLDLAERDRFCHEPAAER